ncbi:hypothetical protein CXF68_06505 [Tenacibaculum sp. Bg11-29]|uniref:hypothetical protein n=1 Tax=Tenacibaculum sp. Bg11-29 TaxID=2058306 RepID=UPI000C32CF28|nr:hypothetical protein [Tenacibaculum sp. Bg11-29]PKH50372.1 hypothetical protein CXF68_06505 [Tenacibaculum sp. Bg11-29]
MIIADALQQFYKENNFAKDGGESEGTFNLKFKLFTLKLPNSQFRKEVVHIHDIQHILYNCDTTWKGEAFIAGWEISTNLWKHFPIGFMSLWAMGFSLLNYPKEVYKGYKAGRKVTGIIDLQLNKQQLLALSVKELKEKIQKKNTAKMGVIQFTGFIFWAFISIIVFLFPISLTPLLLLF